ncbi:MAG TPA: c-type cytochrome [Gammaproteobacteria bacterium]|nr:c-type cytochrome [Gammaproteobacteria bacterium]
MKYLNSIRHRSFISVATFLAAASLQNVASAADFPEPGNFSNGSVVWAQNCNRCHNMRGPKELRDDQWISTSYHMRLRAGLTGQETRDVITFLQGSNTKTVAAGATQVASIMNKGATGKETFEKTCVACHGADGKGAFPGTPDFTRSDGALSKTDSVLIDHISNGFQSEGSPMAMPPKGGNPNLSESGIKAVLSYIRETFSQ